MVVDVLDRGREGGNGFNREDEVEELSFVIFWGGGGDHLGEGRVRGNGRVGGEGGESRRITTKGDVGGKESRSEIGP